MIVTTNVHPKGVVLTVENTDEQLTPQVVATLGERASRRRGDSGGAAGMLLLLPPPEEMLVEPISCRANRRKVAAAELVRPTEYDRPEAQGGR